MKEQRVAMVVARICLAAGFLSAVADRFGLWGPPGANGVAWGDWKQFVDSVAAMIPYAPKGIIPALAGIATLAEIVFGVLLLVGFRLRWVAYGSAVLLVLFATAMTISSGIKSPLDYSVFAAAGAALLVGANARDHESK